MRVLDVGAGTQSFMRQQHPGADVVTIDADKRAEPDIVMDVTDKEFHEWDVELFDKIWMSHVLEHLPLANGKRAIDKLVSLLLPGGELHVKVPSMEWAAEQIYWETDSPVVLFHVYGGQQNEWQIHKWGYTLPLLRLLLTSRGLWIGAAVRGMYEIEYNGSRYPAEELYVVGVKPLQEEKTCED